MYKKKIVKRHFLLAKTVFELPLRQEVISPLQDRLHYISIQFLQRL